ncbi:hypothetical protein ACSFBX_35205 [Variovorax sp. RB2P76]|jgi:ABC-type glutathione transport system ATPase component|uniref:hypothetical protein n=1 Tax=Variovorax sp. RB2P76 TaxID=3443736 RepID=UPI003F47F367
MPEHSLRGAIAAKLLSELQLLEESGDLVITHHVPSILAERLCDAIIQRWAGEFLDEPPPEVVIEASAHSTAHRLSKDFGMNETDAQAISRSFLDLLGATRSRQELAELANHQGPQEMAVGAYYCVKLGLGAYYSNGYLNWRKSHYAAR